MATAAALLPLVGSEARAAAPRRLLPVPLQCPSFVQAVVAEAAPRYDGHRMARQLADAKIQTTLIADSAVFAMMARANKVWTVSRLLCCTGWGYSAGQQGLLAEDSTSAEYAVCLC